MVAVPLPPTPSPLSGRGGVSASRMAASTNAPRRAERHEPLVCGRRPHDATSWLLGQPAHSQTRRGDLRLDEVHRRPATNALRGHRAHAARRLLRRCGLQPLTHGPPTARRLTHKARICARVQIASLLPLSPTGRGGRGGEGLQPSGIRMRRRPLLSAPCYTFTPRAARRDRRRVTRACEALRAGGA